LGRSRTANVGQHRFQLLTAVLQRVEIDPHDLEPPASVGLRHLLERFDLGGTGQAPTCPEDDQDDLPPSIGKVKRLAVDICSPNRGCGLAHLVETSQAAGQELLDDRTLGVSQDNLQGLARFLELGSLNQSLIIGVANSHNLAGREFCPGRSALRGLLSFRDGLPKTLERLLVVPAIGLGDDLY
jgi:hypothetical protein